jgi:pimeloyl-ACP methyl ester carboxylesterase
MPQRIDGVAHARRLTRGLPPKRTLLRSSLFMVVVSVHGAGMTTSSISSRTTVTPSLRGHGGSPVSKPAQQMYDRRLLDDVRSVAATLPAAPVLIGRFMGGLIVQKYLETDTTPLPS